MENYEVKSYKLIDGKEQLQEWGSGFSYNHAKSYFQSLYDSNEYSTVRMTKTK